MASVVVGLGKTGASCLRYFAKHGIAAAATDSRQSPPGLAELGPLARTLEYAGVATIGGLVSLAVFRAPA